MSRRRPREVACRGPGGPALTAPRRPPASCTIPTGVSGRVLQQDFAALQFPATLATQVVDGDGEPPRGGAGAIRGGRLLGGRTARRQPQKTEACTAGLAAGTPTTGRPYRRRTLRFEDPECEAGERVRDARVAAPDDRDVLASARSIASGRHLPRAVGARDPSKSMPDVRRT